MRTKKSLRNILVTLGFQLITVFVRLYAQSYFFDILGEEYYGLQGLFANVLSVLSLTEMGFTTAMLFALFRPIADGDEERLLKLMAYFRKIFMRIGMFIFLGGLAVIPLLPLFIDATVPTGDIAVYYVLFLTGQASTYFFAYNKTLLNAYQDRYLTMIIAYGAYILMNAVQILIIYYFKSYYLFLIIAIVSNVGEGLVLRAVTRKRHPFMKRKAQAPIDADSRKSIGKNIKALFMHRIGGAAVSQTDNIIISAVVGLVKVGSNVMYTTILAALSTIIGQTITGITGSVGDLSTTNNKERMFEVYCIGFYINACVILSVTTVLWFIINDFIMYWLNTDLFFPDSIVVVILLNFLLNNIRLINASFRDTQGLFWYDRYKPIVEAVINLAVSIVLVIKIGIIGVFLGTTISFVTTSFWVEPMVLYKYGFQRSVLDYFKRYGFYVLVAAVGFGVVWMLSSAIGHGTSIITVLLRGALYLAVSAGVFIGATFWTPEFRGMKDILFNVLLKKTPKPDDLTGEG